MKINDKVGLKIRKFNVEMFETFCDFAENDTCLEPSPNGDGSTSMCKALKRVEMMRIEICKSDMDPTEISPGDRLCPRRTLLGPRRTLLGPRRAPNYIFRRSHRARGCNMQLFGIRHYEQALDAFSSAPKS